MYEKKDYNIYDEFLCEYFNITPKYSKEKTLESPLKENLTPYRIYDNNKNYDKEPSELEVRFLNKNFYYPENPVDSKQKIK